VDDHLIESVKPTTVEEAVQLGQTLLEQSWFDPAKIQLGGIFPITAVMTDLRDKNDPHWTLVCAMVDNMPQQFGDADTDPDSPSNIYNNLHFNMTNVRHGREDRSPKGIEEGHRVYFFEDKKVS